MKKYLKIGLTNPKQRSRIQHIDSKSTAKIYRLKDDDRESKLIQKAQRASGWCEEARVGNAEVHS